MSGDVVLAFGITLFAGLATALGSLVAFASRRTNRTFLSIALGFSAGAMLYISFVQVLPQAHEDLGGDLLASWVVLVCFALGALAIALIDRVVPRFGNPHENLAVEFLESKSRKADFTQQSTLMRTSVFVAFAVALHNFPEGIAAFFVTLDEAAVGVALGIAIAIHNVPEGIAVSVPVYYATGSRRKALYYSAASGLAEPLGALLAFVILAPFLSTALVGVILASVAGVMVFVALDQMLPVARDYGRPHLVVYGVVGGMLVMGGSLILLGL